MNSEKADLQTFSVVAAATTGSKSPIAGNAEILKEIINLKKDDARTLASVAYAIRDAKTPIKDCAEILKKIIKIGKNKKKILFAVGKAIEFSRALTEQERVELRTTLSHSP